ncbi:unnamed protein product [Prunus armeniaca]
MVAYCYNKNSLVKEALWKQQKSLEQKSLRRPRTTTTKVEFLEKEAMERFTKEYYQTIAWLP